MKIFWSWQSDTAEKFNKHFVRTALLDALELAAKNLDLAEADRPELDHDTKGAPGLVSIVDVIFNKIEKSEIFVGDITFVGTTQNNKLLPNPNVMIELGHAITSIGADRIILVSNAAYGGRPEDLPFDLRHRRGPITYNLPPETTATERKVIQAKLTKELAVAISGCLGEAIEQRAAEIEFPMHPSRPGDRSIWLKKGEKIQHQGWFSDPGDHEWSVVEAPRSYLRIIPASYDRTHQVRELHEMSKDSNLYALGPWINADGGANGPGFVKVGYLSAPPGIVIGATQWFEDTGEVWGFNGAASFTREGLGLLASIDIPKRWLELLNSALDFQTGIGAKGPFQVEAGVVGLKNVRWGVRAGKSYGARKEEVFLRRVDIKWAKEARREFLFDLFNALGDNFNQNKVTTDEFKAICP